MSGVEILGIAAGVLQVAELGGRLSVKLFTFGRKIKNADKNIDSISQEIAATGAVLQQLGNTLKKDDQRKLCSDEAVATARDLVAECHKVFSELEDSLDGRSSSSKIVSIWKRRLKYPFLEPQLDLLRSNLERLKSSLLVMLNILVLAGQIKSQEALPILREQRTLIEVLVEDSAANSAKFDQVMKRLEGLNLFDPIENQDDSRDFTFQQTNCNTGDLNHKAVSKPAELKLSTNACNKIPHHRLEEIIDHSHLVSELVQKVKAAQGKINLGLKHNLHERVLDVHWEEWSTLRGVYGEDALMQSFSHHEDLSRFWTSKTEKEALNIQRGPVPFDVASERPVPRPRQYPTNLDTHTMEYMSPDPAYPDFMTTSHHSPRLPDPSQDASGLQNQSNYASINENSSTMQAPSIHTESPVTYTPTTHRVSKAKKGKRIFACEFPGCSKVFTRAEHKRRHEGNHSFEAPYPCSRSGCRKAFHRPDLLQRHLERHELEASDEAPHSGPISIGSLVNQDCLRGSYDGYDNGIGAHASLGFPYLQRFPSFEDSLYYNTPDNGISPRSDEGQLGPLAAHPDKMDDIEVINRPKTSSKDDSPSPKISPDLESPPRRSGFNEVNDLLSRFTCLTAEEINAAQC